MEQQNYKKITNRNDIEIAGRIYFLPDYLNINQTPGEYIALFKFLVAKLIHLSNQELSLEISNITMPEKKKLEINKKQYQTIINTAEKIYAFILGGKMNIINFNTMENKIISSIPEILIPKFNPNITEKIE